MTLQQLRYAIAVADCGSMNQAAAKLFISQPSLSEAVKELEGEIGIRIFGRTNRGILVTTEGNEFLGYARQVVEQYRLMEQRYVEKTQTKKRFAVSMQQKVLRSMIEEVAFAVSTNESRPVHTGALFEIADMSLSMVAVDGFRLAFRREKLEKLEGGAFSFVCPGSALSEVKSICGDTEDLVTVTLGKRHILFEIGDTQLICRRLEGEFLDYKNAIPRKNPIQIVAETKALIESIDRVSVVISDKLKSPVRCLFDHDKVMLSAKTGNGEAKDVCRVSGDGDKLEIGFNNRYLMEALRYAPADKVKIELNTGVSPAIIVPVEGEENFLYMVLPVRLKSAE